MKKLVALVALLAIASLGVTHSWAADDAKPAPAAAAKARPLPFKATLKGFDKDAMTVTAGERTYKVTAATRITVGDNKKATLADLKPDEEVRGSYKKTEAGLEAVSLTQGPKAQPAKK